MYEEAYQRRLGPLDRCSADAKALLHFLGSSVHLIRRMGSLADIMKSIEIRRVGRHDELATKDLWALRAETPAC